MKVLVTGPESTGGRFVGRWLAADDGLEVVQRSLPFEGRHLRHWPTEHDYDGFGPDRVVLTLRGWVPTRDSQVGLHVPSRAHAESNMVEALRRFFGWVGYLPLRWVVYENLCAYPERVMGDLFGWLGREPVGCPEPVVDGNPKHLVLSPAVTRSGT